MSQVATANTRVVTKGGRVLTSERTAANVIRDGATVAWYDSSDLTTITKDGSDYVSRWADKLGSGRDLIQATAAKQPKWFVTDGILFDGVDDSIKAAFTFIQPETIYLVFKPIVWTINKKVIDGNTLNALPFKMVNYANRYGFGLQDSELLITNGTLAIIRIKIINNIATEILNNTTTIVGAKTGNMTGISIGSSYNDAYADWSNIQVKEIILRNVVDSPADETTIYNYLAAKYGFTTI
jgi:hypothetical protein